MTDDEDSRTIWCGNLAENVTHDILYELFYQAGPLEKVRIPRKEGRQRNFGFITYCHQESVRYAIDLFNGTALYDRVLTMKMQSRHDSKKDSPDIPMLRGRPMPDFPKLDPAMEQQFISMTNHMAMNGIPIVANPYEGSSMTYGQFSTSQSLGAASLQGQWMAPRHRPHDDRDSRRFDPYRRRGEWDRGRDRGRSDRDRNGDSRDYHGRHRNHSQHGGHNQRSHHNHSRD